jgi:hypothetical protein
VEKPCRQIAEAGGIADARIMQPTLFRFSKS